MLIGKQQRKFSKILCWYGQTKLCQNAGVTIDIPLVGEKVMRSTQTEIEVAPQLFLQRDAEEQIELGVLANEKNKESR